jgi:hypothetical protein
MISYPMCDVKNSVRYHAVYWNSQDAYKLFYFIGILCTYSRFDNKYWKWYQKEEEDKVCYAFKMGSHTLYITYGSPCKFYVIL